MRTANLRAATMQPADARPRLIIFDSGVGGLSVLREIRASLPESAITYVADNGGFPYGDLDDGTMVARIAAILDTLLPRLRPDAVVVACNTASTIALPTVRGLFPDVPFVGCVPAIKPAASISRTRAIGLLATPATVRRPYTLDLIARFAADCRVVSVGAVHLAALAEARLRGHEPDPALVAREAAPLFTPSDGPPVDTVVLGCTHYPFLLDLLRAAAPREVTWLESGAAIARRVRAVLADRGAGPAASSDGAGTAIFTAPPADAAALAASLAGFGLARLSVDPLGTEGLGADGHRRHA